MSGLSLISGAETLAASFHLLIDEVLLSKSSIDPTKARQLAELLRAADASHSGTTNHDGLLLDSLLRNADGNPDTALSRLANALEQGTLSDENRLELDGIARRVNQERAALSTRSSAW